MADTPSNESCVHCGGSGCEAGIVGPVTAGYRLCHRCGGTGKEPPRQSLIQADTPAPTLEERAREYAAVWGNRLNEDGVACVIRRQSFIAGARSRDAEVAALKNEQLIAEMTLLKRAEAAEAEVARLKAPLSEDEVKAMVRAYTALMDRRAKEGERG